MGSQKRNRIEARGRLEKVLDWATVSQYRTGENPARWRGHLEQLLPAPSGSAKTGKSPRIAVGRAARIYAAPETVRRYGRKSLRAFDSDSSPKWRNSRHEMG